jgi:hypothetical protein
LQREDIAAEQNRWTDFNRRLEDLERVLTPRSCLLINAPLVERRERRAKADVGESEGRSPLDEIG